MAERTDTPEIFFHVGLGKTGTTYLQYRFFPKLRGIKYLQRGLHRRYAQLIAHGSAPRYMLSREYDNQLEAEVSQFAARWPNTRSIIVLRRNDGWIASQYRRHVKNGGLGSFTDFLDVEHDTGSWRVEQTRFMNKIEALEKYFDHKPLVLFYDDMRSDPQAFFGQLARYVGADFDPASISLRRVHTSYDEKQLKYMQAYAAKHFTKPPRYAKNKLLAYLQFRWRFVHVHAVLYWAQLVPKGRVSPEPLIPQKELDKVRDYFADDWAACRAYAAKNNPVLYQEVGAA